MTPDEYARKIASDLRSAHTSRNQAAIPQIFERADKALLDASFTTSEQRDFWGTVRSHLSGDVLLEKQANGALLALMRAIETQIAARAKR